MSAHTGTLPAADLPVIAHIPQAWRGESTQRARPDRERSAGFANLILEMMERVRCRWCHEMVGVFDPIVVLAEGDARETSLLIERAAGSHSRVPAGACYHPACYDAAHEGSSSSR